jgi:uncharacterized membrane protein
MTRTLKTGLQFLATSVVCGVISGLNWMQVREAFPQTYQGFGLWLCFVAAVAGFFAAATGVAAVSYLIASVIEAVGRVLDKRNGVAERD